MMLRRTLFVTLTLAAAACGTDIQSGVDTANTFLYRQEYLKAERLYRKLLKRLGVGSPGTELEFAL